MKRLNFLHKAQSPFPLKEVVITSLLVGAIALPIAYAKDKVVRVYNWSDYMKPEVLEDFTQKTGIKVIYDTFDSNEMLLAKTLAGGSQYDIVVPSSFTVSYLIQAGKLEKIDFNKLENRDNIAPFVNERLEALPGVSDYSVAYMWNSTGFAYNVKEVTERLPNADADSLSLLFDPQNAKALASCGIYVLDTPTEVMPLALMYLGLDPNSTNDEDLAKVEALFKAIRPYIKKFHSSEYLNAMANGDACLAIGWSGDFYNAKARAKDAGKGVDIRYVIPKEGSIVGFDQLTILSSAENKAEAYQLIDFLIDGKNNAEIANFLDYSTPNQAAYPYLTEASRNDEGLYPPKEVIDRMQMFKPQTQKEQKKIMKRWLNITMHK